MHILILIAIQNGGKSRWNNCPIFIKKLLLKHNFQDEGHLCANFFFYVLTIYRKCLIFQFLSRGMRMHIPILVGVQKGRISRWKNGYILLKKLLLKCNFEDAGHFSADCFFFILAIYHKCFLFQFLGCGIRMQIPILTGVHKGCISSWKYDYISHKNVLLMKTNFQHEGRLYVNFLCYILSCCFKCLLFEFLSRGIRTHIPIETGVLNGEISRWKTSHNLQ